MSRVREAIKLFDLALETNEFSKYYTKISELTIGELKDFSEQWQVHALTSESQEYENMIYRVDYNRVSGVLPTTFGQHSNARQQFIENVFTQCAYPKIVENISHMLFWNRHGIVPMSREELKNIVSGITYTEFLILSLVEAARTSTILDIVQYNLTVLLSLDFTDV